MLARMCVAGESLEPAYSSKRKKLLMSLGWRSLRMMCRTSLETKPSRDLADEV